MKDKKFAVVTNEKEYRNSKYTSFFHNVKYFETYRECEDYVVANYKGAIDNKIEDSEDWDMYTKKISILEIAKTTEIFNANINYSDYWDSQWE